MFHSTVYSFIMWNCLFLNDYISNYHLSNLYIILYKLYIILHMISSSSFTLQMYLYQRINAMSYPLYRSIPEKHLATMPYPTCKNAQYPTYTKKHAVILYYYGMFYYPGVFTFSETAVFSPGRGCVQLKRRPPNLNHRFYTHFINCVKITHNLLKSPKSTSKWVSVKSLYFLAKLNFLTI